jgi:hypothetical protein
MFGKRHDTMKWFPRALVEKWDDDQVAWCRSKTGILRPSGDDLLASGVKPYALAESEGDLLTTVGLDRLTDLLVASGGQGMTNTATRLGVGNGAGSAAVGDTDLGAAAGSANRWFQIMDATYPSASNGVMTAKATFATGDGNFAWNEWGLDIGTPTVSSSAVVNAVLFNHKTSAALGTKASGSWALTVTVTIS